MITLRCMRECIVCGSKRRITRHHVKNRLGEETGKIEILCRQCHDIVERQYENEGRIICAPRGYGKKKIRKNTAIARKVEVIEIVKESLLSFNTIYPKFKEIVKGQGFHG